MTVIPRQPAQQNAITMWRRGLLWLILLVALALRVANLLQIEHNIDQAYYIGQALRTLDAGEWPLVGQNTSFSFPNGALLGYVYLPFIALTRTALAAYMLVIALNTLAVYLAFRVTNRLFGIRAGLIAAALLAVNPWLIEYSRNTWTHALLPFLLLALADRLWPLLLGRSRRLVRDALLAAGCVTLITQTSLLGYLLLPGLGLLILRFWRRLPLRGVLLGALLFAIAQVLFLAGLLAEWDVRGQQLNRFQEAASTAYVRPEAFLHALRLVSGAHYELNRGLQAPSNDAALRHTLSEPATTAVACLLMIGIGLSVWHLRNPKRRDLSLILLVWFFAPVALMSYNSAQVHPFYLLLTLPAGAVLAAWGADWLLNWIGRGAPVLAVVLLLPFSALMGVNSLRYDEETAHIPGAHGLTALPLAWGLPLGAELDAALPEDGRLFLLPDPVYGAESQLPAWILHSFAGRVLPIAGTVRAPQSIILPQAGGLYLQMVPGSSAPVALPSDQRMATLTLPDGNRIALDRTDAHVTPTIAQDFVAQGERWLTFAGYDLAQTGRDVTLTTFWQVQVTTPELLAYTFVPFVHVINAEGNRRAIVDGLPISTAQWQAGDWHIQRLQFTLPEDTEDNGPFSLRVGQYDGVQQSSLIFILPDGTYSATIALPEQLTH